MSDTVRVAVVSGGGTGLGRAIAQHLMDDGMHVVITGRREDVLADAAEALRAAADDGSVSWVRADASVPADVQALADAVGTEFGTVDAVVANAGGFVRTPSGTLEEVAEHWRASFELNALTAIVLTYGLAPLLRRPGGRIVLMSSMAATSGAGDPAYAAVKSLLHGWVLSLMATYGPEGITANVLVPGYVPDTELLGAGLPPAMHDHLVSRIVIGRAGRPEDVGAAVSYLVSPAASFVTGQLLEVSGGTFPPQI